MNSMKSLIECKQAHLLKQVHGNNDGALPA